LKVLGQPAAARPGAIDHRRPAKAVKEWIDRLPGREVHVAGRGLHWLAVRLPGARGKGATPHLAEPTETAARRSAKRRAKTDRADARHLRTLLSEGRPPESWMPSPHVREWRTRTRLRKTLIDERTAWLARVQATLFHHGITGMPERLLCSEGREFLDELDLPSAAIERICVAMAIVDAIDRQMAPIERELRLLARRQRGCQALRAHQGVGELTAPVILCELGDVSRLSASRQAVRLTGLDVGVHRSDRRWRPGKLTRQGESPRSLRGKIVLAVRARGRRAACADSYRAQRSCGDPT
jgi:transposase